MKKSIIYSAVGVCLMIAMAWAQTNKSGTISASQTWSGQINVVGNVTINAGTVTVQPGTVVKFMSNYSINVNGTGNLTAVGTAASPILFTSGLASPVAGSWGTLIFQNLSNAPTTAFAYCTFEYAATATEFRNHGNGTPVLTIDHCTYRHCAASAIYVTQAWKTSVTYCTFRALRSPAFFSHAVSTLILRYCSVDSVPVGFVFQGFSGTVAQKDTVDHCTIYGADIRLASGGGTYTWNGSAIAMDLTPAGTVRVTNSIIQKTKMLCGLKTAPGWTSSDDYNCWFDNGYGGMDHVAQYSDATFIKDITPGSHSVVDQDPLLVNPAHGDMRLRTGSPCIGKASDGKNIGCSQEVVSDIRQGMAVATMPGIQAAANPNPFMRRTIITVHTADMNSLPATVAIYTIEGKLVRQFTGITAHAVWDGSNQQGLPAPAGLYVFLVQRGTQHYQGRLMLAGK